MMNESDRVAGCDATESSGSCSGIARCVSQELGGEIVGRMVLLVEDDAGLRQLETAMLERMGLRVLSADCDYQARWLWDRHWREIDVLLTDVMIPSCTTGFELARRFRAEKPNLEVIYASGFSREIAGEDAGQLRDTLFLQKPFGQERLGKAIAACLESARRRLGREPGGLASR